MKPYNYPISRFSYILLSLLVLLCQCKSEQDIQQTQDLDFSRILIIGNSITKHGPAPEIGWLGNWGMAASAREKDYFHRLKSKFESIPEHDSIILTRTVAFEASFWDFDFSRLDSLKPFEPTLIILNLGENVDDNMASDLNYGSHLLQLINYLREDHDITIVCVDSFWDKPAVNAQVQEISKKEHFIFVGISDLGTLENQAFADFENVGVGAHPNDNGMEMIAERIGEALGI